MAFVQSSPLVRKEIAKGVVAEQYTWVATAVTTGTIAPDTTDSQNYGQIVRILGYSITDTTTPGGATVVYDNNQQPSALTVACTSGDAGSVTIWGLVG